MFFHSADDKSFLFTVVMDFVIVLSSDGTVVLSMLDDRETWMVEDFNG